MFEKWTDEDTELSVFPVWRDRVVLELDWGDGITEFHATPEQAREIADQLTRVAKAQEGTR